MDRHVLATNEANNGGLWDWNLATNRVHYSPRWISMLGCQEHELGNTPEDWLKRIHPEDLDQVKRALDAQAASASSRFETEHRMLHADGTYRWMSCRVDIIRDEAGNPIRMTGSHSDITPKKVTDALTGLPNRLLLLDRLTGSIERSRRRDGFLFAVFLLDLDRFRPLVERIGSTAGDQLLIAVARRLETFLRASDTVARLGRDHVVAHLDGDEFIVLLEGLNEVSEAKNVAERLLMELSAPFRLGGREVFVTASIGVALSATGYNRSEEVLRDADIALHRAKSLGKARCEVFDTAVLDSVQSRLQLEEDLQGAMDRQEFSVVYQPVLSLTPGRIEGFEALMRWNHPTRGSVPPPEFIPIAEKTGLIVPLGRWVLNEACRQLKAWKKSNKSRKNLWISVNFSIVQFKQPAVVEEIERILRSFDLDPHCLLVELTESVVMENPEAVRSLLMQLRVMGVRIALDDFGSGYSSFGYLRQLPVDFIKIDRCFVRRMESGKDAVEIVRTMTDLAHQLGLRVIAEGIEDAVQLQLIRSANCDCGQGFLFSRPVDGGKCSGLLKAGFSRDRRAGSRKEASVEGKDSSGPSFEPADLPAPENGRAEMPAPVEGAGRNRGTNALLAVTGVLIFIWAVSFISKLSHWNQPSPVVGSEFSQPSPQKPPETRSVAATPQPLAAPVSDQEPLPAEVNSTAVPVPPIAPGEVIRKPTPAAKLPLKLAQGNTAPVKATPPKPPTQDAGLSAAVTPPPPKPPSVSIAPKEAAPPQASVKDAGLPSKQAATRTLAVIHAHMLGSCRGVLRLASDSLSFVSLKEKDGFTFSYSECTWGLSKDRLVIKSGSRTYRFKSATARGKEENLSQLRGVVESISSLAGKPVLPSGNPR